MRKGAEKGSQEGRKKATGKKDEKKG